MRDARLSDAILGDVWPFSLLKVFGGFDNIFCVPEFNSHTHVSVCVMSYLSFRTVNLATVSLQHTCLFK